MSPCAAGPGDDREVGVADIEKDVADGFDLDPRRGRGRQVRHDDQLSEPSFGVLATSVDGKSQTAVDRQRNPDICRQRIGAVDAPGDRSASSRRPT